MATRFDTHRKRSRKDGWTPLILAGALTIASVAIANAQPTHLPPGVFALPGRPPAKNPARAEEQRQEQLRAQQERQRHEQEGGSK